MIILHEPSLAVPDFIERRTKPGVTPNLTTTKIINIFYYIFINNSVAYFAAVRPRVVSSRTGRSTGLLVHLVFEEPGMGDGEGSNNTYTRDICILTRTILLC